MVKARALSLTLDEKYRKADDNDIPTTQRPTITNENGYGHKDPYWNSTRNPLAVWTKTPAGTQLPAPKCYR